LPQAIGCTDCGTGFAAFARICVKYKSPMKIRGLRWWIVVLLFLAAVLNYVDRQTLSALAPTIQADLAMDDRDYANIVNIFLIAYTVSYLVSGKIADRIGTRASMAVFVAWWSVANMLTSAAQGMRSLGMFRFMLGLGEAGVWPAASRAVSEWLPARERALAIGIYTMGATAGATVAPYIVIPLASFQYAESFPALQSLFGQGTGWRIAFVLTGAAGLAWLLPWLLLYSLPRSSPYLRDDESRIIHETRGPDAAPGLDEPWSWRKIFSTRVVWLLLMARLATDPAWYFFQFWFPKYLNAERGLSQRALTITWLIYAAAGVGSLLGGWLSGRIVRRGASPPASRMWVMSGCAALMPLSALVPIVDSTSVAMVASAVVVIASLAWLINLSSLVIDLVPRHSLGTVFGVVAAGSTIGGMLMNMVVAVMVSGPAKAPAGFLDASIQSVFGCVLDVLAGKGYAEWFVIMSFLHPLALLMLFVGGVQRHALDGRQTAG